MTPRIAVGGATGNVGQELLKVLAHRRFPHSAFAALASRHSAGQTLAFNGAEHTIGSLDEHDFTTTDILFLSAGGDVAREIAPRAGAAGCLVIDNSSAFRMHEDVPLVVPEVNPQALDRWAERRILPVANCSTIQLVMVLHVLERIARINRVVVSTYQSASGGGRRMLERLLSPVDAVGLDMRGLMMNAKAALEKGGPKPLAFNVVPHIDVFLDDGRTKEEWKMEVESRRILGRPDLKLAATCARVPVLVGHAEAVSVEFDGPVSEHDARAALAGAPGITLRDARSEGGYATPLEVMGTDDVWVSRLRMDPTVDHGLQMWIVADNIRKGAALNAVQLGEAMLARDDFKAHLRAR